MDKLYSPATMAKIREKHGFRHSKSLGQNFLTDINIIDAIIEGSEIGSEDLVIEIGPGMGVLTAAAAEAAGRVIAVEIDRHLIPILKDTLAEYDNIEIINADIMKTDLTELIESNRQAGRVRIIGNLPYYITTPIVMKLLEERVPADSITIMMQKEVADRMKAEPGGKTYGALTVAVGFYCTVSHVANAPKEVFVPRPKVDSTVIRLDIREKPPVELINEKIFFETIKNGFGQRRKTLLNSLTGVQGLAKEQIGEALKSAGIDPKRRAETLSLKEFAELANSIVNTLKNR
ncbi:MAG: 16S rRNA (adenine(1518)-N(6)/adenine(1519)-N(6))-dimethyltransferase RsmA [Firmicutes bacterium]|nr:16S rRNA (adenine(1518)-N(6)/adenine(1519)-N(6))-dimethyltransferase RsmA [Bacillota bacterium]